MKKQANKTEEKNVAALKHVYKNKSQYPNIPAKIINIHYEHYQILKEMNQ